MSPQSGSQPPTRHRSWTAPCAQSEYDGSGDATPWPLHPETPLSCASRISRGRSAASAASGVRLARHQRAGGSSLTGSGDTGSVSRTGGAAREHARAGGAAARARRGLGVRCWSGRCLQAPLTQVSTMRILTPVVDTRCSMSVREVHATGCVAVGEREPRVPPPGSHDSPDGGQDTSRRLACHRRRGSR